MILHFGLLRMFLPSTDMIYCANHNSVDFFFFFKFNPILPNAVFKFLSLTFSFHSSCCFNFSLVLPWLISLPTYFCYLPFTLFCIKIQFVISLVIFHIKRTSFRITSFIQFLIRHANCTKSEVYH